MDIEILNRTNKIIKQILSEPNLVIDTNTKASEIPKWDSLSHIEIIASLEKEFDIKFNFREIMNFQNIGDLIICIKNHISNK